jgi:hypothetical protein
MKTNRDNVYFNTEELIRKMDRFLKIACDPSIDLMKFYYDDNLEGSGLNTSFFAPSRYIELINHVAHGYDSMTISKCDIKNVHLYHSKLSIWNANLLSSDSPYCMNLKNRDIRYDNERCVFYFLYKKGCEKHVRNQVRVDRLAITSVLGNIDDIKPKPKRL